MGGLRAGEGQGALVVREVTLDGGPLAEEAFLKEGSGSAFVSRPGVLVHLTAGEKGLALLPKKVEQLIGRGFHAIAVRVEGDRLADDAWSHLRAAAAYVEQFAGFLVLCGVSAPLKAAVEAAAKKDGKGLVVRFVRDRDEAAAELKKHEAGVDPLEVQSGESLTSASGDSTASADDDWGGDWGGGGSKDSGRLPRVDVAEMLVEAEELPALRDRVAAALKKGKKYFTVRLHFKRRMTSDDLKGLVAARDAASRGGGLLVLAALQKDVSEWLRLLGEERNFVIAESADEAERTHRRHASGEAVGPAPAPAPADAPGFVVVAKDARSLTVRPAAGKAKPIAKTTTAATRVITLGRDGLPGLGARAKRLGAEGVQDVIADLGRFKEIRGERFDELPKAVEAARKAGVRLAFGNVSREVKALLKILGVAEGGEAGTTALAETLEGAALRLAALRPAFEELRLELTTEELAEAPPVDPVSSVDLEEPALAAPRASGGAADGAALAAATAEGAAAKAEAQRAAAERDSLKKRAQELEAERDALKKRAADVEAQARKALEEAKERVEKKLEEQRAAAQKEAERAKAVAAELEQKKKRMAELELAVQAGDAQAEEGAAKLRELEKELVTVRGRLQELEAQAFRAKQLEATVAERDRKVASLEDELKKAMSSAGAAGQVHEGRIAALERDLAEARKAAGKVQQLEASVAERDRRVAALEQDVERARAAAKAAPAGAAAPVAGGDEGLRRRVGELERENARILTEAEQEIQRLMKEQQLLREELESAGEMIERLGKELEFS